METKVAVLIVTVLACCVAYAGSVYAETVHFHVGGPVSSASPSVKAQPATDNMQGVQTHGHPGVLMVQGWPVDLPYHDPECGGVIEEALQKNSEVYVADADCRAAMQKALYIQRTTPPPDPKYVLYGIRNVIPEAPEVPTDQQPPQTDEPAEAGTPRLSERAGPFLRRLPN